MGTGVGKIQGQEQAIQKLRDDFNRMLSEEKAKHEEAEKRYQDSEQRHKDDQSAMKTRIEKLESEKERYDQTIERLTMEISRLKLNTDLMEEYERQINVLKTEKKELENKLREKDSEIKKLKSKIPNENQSETRKTNKRDTMTYAENEQSSSAAQEAITQTKTKGTTDVEARHDSEEEVQTGNKHDSTKRQPVSQVSVTGGINWKY